MEKVKGIILAGGDGTRLKPMTDLISKQLLPIYNKPMIFYPLSILINCGIKEIAIITKSADQNDYKNILSDGNQWGVKIHYFIQDKPNGIAEAFLITEEWLNNSPSMLILGDNLFYGKSLTKIIKKTCKKDYGASIFVHQVSNPKRYGVISLDENKNVSKITEKPSDPDSNWAVTGLYYYDQKAPKYVKNLKPSKRGELEITDLNNIYLKKDKLDVEFLGGGYTWLDAGTADSLLEASNFVKNLKSSQGLSIGEPSINNKY